MIQSGGRNRIRMIRNDGNRSRVISPKWRSCDGGSGNKDSCKLDELHLEDRDRYLTPEPIYAKRE
jgi:hypothetical protein